MHTSVGFLAFASFLSGFSWDTAQSEIPWKATYQEGRSHGQKVKKPLAVIVGAGKTGYQKLIQDGSLTSDVRKILANEYIPVYLDSEKAENKRLIADLGITLGKGIVLSNREGNTQAFFHDGTISEGDLTRQLKHFADPTLVVQTTVTLSTYQSSFYPSLGSSRTSYYPYSGTELRFGTPTTTQNC